ncbi:MAG: acyl carrier protein [Marinibacterium sp.]
MTVTNEAAEAALKEIFEDLSEDLDAEPVDFTAETRLVDLGMESISLIYLVSELQQHFELEERLFQYLRDTERLLIDMNVGDILAGVTAVSTTATEA